MPARVHDILAPRRLALPATIYLDSSILLGAYRFAGTRRPRPDEVAAHRLLSAIRLTPDAWTSLLAIEETCWWPLAKSLRREADAHSLSVAQLKQRQPVAYARAYGDGRPKADHLMGFLKELPIAVRLPRHRWSTSEGMSRALCFAVRGFLAKYDLEMADFFHIAMALLDGTKAIATLDRGFLDVDGIDVYTCA